MVKQISLRLPDELHERLKAAAERNRRSLHAEILWRLEQDPAEGGSD
jgi:predicted DNA-binding protein